MRSSPRGVLIQLLSVVVVLTSCSDQRAELKSEVAAPAVRAVLRGLIPRAGANPTGKNIALRALPGLVAGTPIVDGDFADPFVLASGSDLYGYSTNTSSAKVPVFRLRLGTRNGDYLGDALTAVASWSEPGFVWAPAVATFDDHFVLYYSTRVAGTSMQCVSRATSVDPAGPFVDDSTEPMVCQRDRGGTIDPSVFTDAEGVRWLLFKNDGNCCGLPVSLWSARLTDDGTAIRGDAHQLLTAESTWEGQLIEGPSMVHDHGEHFLFYSANAWDSERYAIGVARCESAAGPCRRISEEAWRSSRAFARGPGGQEFFNISGRTWMVYHAWAVGDPIEPGAQRRLFVDVVSFRDGRPRSVGKGLGVGLGIALAASALALVATVVLRRRRRRWTAERRRAAHRGADTTSTHHLGS